MIEFNNLTFNIYLGDIEPTIYLGTQQVYPLNGSGDNSGIDFGGGSDSSGDSPD